MQSWYKRWHDNDHHAYIHWIVLVLVLLLVWAAVSLRIQDWMSFNDPGVNPNEDLCEFYRSTDSGATWTIQSTGWHYSTDPGRNDGGARLAVTPADPNRV